MNIQNFLIKKIKKLFLTINNLIESNLNKLKLIKHNYKKGELIKNNRVFFSISAIIILTLTYFFLPTLYDKNIIQSKIKNQVQKKYNIEIQFDEKIRYGLIPKPHFVAKDIKIFNDKKEIAVSNDLKIFISIKKFFSMDNLEVKDLIFTKTDFNIKFEDIHFFYNLLNTQPNENKIVWKKSNLFFKSVDDEVLFLNKIEKGKFFYDSYNLVNVLSAENKIFNTPYKIVIKNDKFNKEINTKFSSKKVRLNIENSLIYDDKEKKGLLDILFINKNTELNYQIKKNSLNFSSNNSKVLNGSIDFKPFYLQANLNYNGVNTKNLFGDDSIFFNLVRSELFNNPNLNINIKFNIKDITNSNELNNLLLNLTLEQGDIKFSNSKILWKDDLEIKMNDALLSHNENEIILNGNITINAKDINGFYKSYQIQKKFRKKITKIDLDFAYNLNKKKLRLDNIRVDNNTNSKLNKFINDHNSNENKFLNKIILKNFINNFFEAYAG